MSDEKGIFPTAITDTLVGSGNKNNDASENEAKEPKESETPENLEKNEENAENLDKKDDDKEETHEEDNKEKAIKIDAETNEDSSDKPEIQIIEAPIIITYEEDGEKQTNAKKESTDDEEETKEKSETETETNSKQSKRKNPPPKNMTYRQQQNTIPKDIRENPYVTKRINTYPVRDVPVPRAALDSSQYHGRPPVELDEYSESVFNGKRKLEEDEEPPTLEQLQKSANTLRNYERELIEKSDYVAAKKAYSAFEYVTKQMQNQKHFNSSKTMIEEMIRKRDALIDNVNKIADRYDESINKLQDEMSQNAQQMRNDHMEALDKFDEEIPTELGPLFKRNSVTYLKMRSEEKHLALTRDFDKAIAKKAQADELQRIEEEMNYEKMNDYYNEKRMRMLEQQNKAVKFFVQNYDQRILTLKSQKNAEIIPYQERVDKLNSLIEKALEAKGISPVTLDYKPLRCDRAEKIGKEKKPEVKRRSHSAMATVGRKPRITRPKVTSSGK